jgi:cellulose 1,4-beta-cellobiosidase
MIVACTPVLEVEEGGSATAVFSTSCQDPTQVDLAVTGDPGVAVSPTSFTSTHDGFGNAVTVSAAPGSAGATATINATSSTGNCLPANVAVTVVGSGPGRNEPPEVTLTSPISGVMHVSVCPVPLAAEASDPDGAVERVEFFVNDVLVNTDQEAPYQFNFGPGGPGAPISGSNTVFARAWDDGSPALSTDSAPATFLLVPPPPNIQIIGCPQRLEIEAGSSGVVDFRLSAQVTIPVELTVSGEADLTVSPTSFTLDSSGQEVTVNAAPGSAGTTGGITATSPMAFGFQVVIEVVGG